MNSKAAGLYARAAHCHQRSINCSKETEQRGWFELASIWMMLADSASAKRIKSLAANDPIELTVEQMTVKLSRLL